MRARNHEATTVNPGAAHSWQLLLWHLVQAATQRAVRKIFNTMVQLSYNPSGTVQLCALPIAIKGHADEMNAAGTMGQQSLRRKADFLPWKRQVRVLLKASQSSSSPRGGEDAEVLSARASRARCISRPARMEPVRRAQCVGRLSRADEAPTTGVVNLNPRVVAVRGVGPSRDNHETRWDAHTPDAKQRVVHDSETGR
eukprot:6211143-Pleurochrysis_carterae.AAC.4